MRRGQKKRNVTFASKRKVLKGRKRVERRRAISRRGLNRITPVPQEINYNQAYDKGFDEAYNEGFSVGYSEGMDAGHQQA